MVELALVPREVQDNEDCYCPVGKVFPSIVQQFLRIAEAPSIQSRNYFLTFSNAKTTKMLICPVRGSMRYCVVLDNTSFISIVFQLTMCNCTSLSLYHKENCLSITRLKEYCEPPHSLLLLNHISGEGLFLAILLRFWLVSGGCSRTWQEQSTRWTKLRMTPSTNKSLTFCYIYASQTKIIPSHRSCFEIYSSILLLYIFLLFLLPVVPLLKSGSLNI